MVGLTALPAELLVLVATSAPSIQSAYRLCSSNRRLYSVWQEHHETIVKNILKNIVPAYDDTARLATLEVCTHASRDAAQNFHLWVERLLHNADLARDTLTGFDTYLSKRGQDGWMRQLNVGGSFSAYYFFRLIVCSYGDPQRERAILEELRAKPKVPMGWEIESMGAYMVGWMDDCLERRHDMVNEGWQEPLDPVDERENDFKHRAEWEFALGMVDVEVKCPEHLRDRWREHYGEHIRALEARFGVTRTM